MPSESQHLDKTVIELSGRIDSARAPRQIKRFPSSGAFRQQTSNIEIDDDWIRQGRGRMGRDWRDRNQVAGCHRWDGDCNRRFFECVGFVEEAMAAAGEEKRSLQLVNSR